MSEHALHLSQIETRWSMVFQAHRPRADETLEAQRELLQQYGGAVQRYLLAVTRDPDLAADLAQDFALRFLRGDFRRADPRRGRFRDFVKTAILHLVIDSRRRASVRPKPVELGPGGAEPVQPRQELADLDLQFLECWKTEMLNHAWNGLARFQERTGSPFYTVLRLRADHPDLRSQALADLLSERLSKPVNAGWVRQNLSRARDKFIEFIIAEVTRSLGKPTPEQVDEELMNLDLWKFCRSGRSTP